MANNVKFKRLLFFTIAKKLLLSTYYSLSISLSPSLSLSRTHTHTCSKSYLELILMLSVRLFYHDKPHNLKHSEIRMN